MNLSISRSVTWCCVGFLSALCGCSVFRKSADEESASGRLPLLVAPRDSVQLEILFVDRPQSDLLMGEKLWAKVDQIAGFSSEERSRLRELGWKIGHSSSHPPKALEELMQSVGTPESMDGDRRVRARRVAIPAGEEIPIEVTDLLPEVKVSLNGKTRTFSEAKAVLRLHVDREQDGWVRLRFVPEIHHGRKLLRPFVTADDWSRRRSQNIVPVYEQQFSMSLNVGELALVTAGDVGGKQVPATFFLTGEDGQLRRLLVIRVANMRRLKPVFRNSSQG